LAKDKISLIILVAVLVSIYCFVFGESGVLERYGIEKKHDIIEKRINKLKFENLLLLKSLNEYKEGIISKEDFVRSGYAGSGEKIIFFHGSVSPRNMQADSGRESAPSAMVDTQHLRILWIIVSILVIVLFYIKIRKNQ
jgi:hypothetical protein